MYDVILNLSRYIFLVYIGFFLLSGFLICLGEKDILNINIKKQLLLQRLIIFFFHFNAFIFLFFKGNTLNYDVLPFFIISSGFLVFANLLAKFFYRRSCGLIWNSIFFISSIGITMLYRLNSYLAYKQLVWLALGFSICLMIPLILSILPRLDFFRYIYLFLGLVLLLATLTIGIENGGAKNWITIKGITFQPSEIVKILFIFYLSSSFVKPSLKIRHLIFPTLMTLIFIACLVFQKDLGGALIFFMTYMVMIFIATSKIWLVFLGTFLGGIGSFIAYNFFSHVRVRVNIWQNPWIDINNKGYQIAQSLFAIGTYGLLGSGFTQGMPNTIPVVERDLIFSAICEEFGVLFGIGLILVFIMLFYRCVRIALDCDNRFLSLLSSGFTSIICFQTFLIIGGTAKFIPLTGVTLPFVSYGGSSILITFVIIGILQWVSIKNVKYMENFEFYDENYENNYNESL